MNNRQTLIRERREILRINISRRRSDTAALCDNCGYPIDCLSVDEATRLFGEESEAIREKLRDLRQEDEEYACDQTNTHR